MMRTLLWKEYREQRGLWLGVALLTVTLSLGLGMALPPQGLAGLAQDRETSGAILVLLVSFAIGYPLVCGALLLAGERDGGTAAFLQYQNVRPASIWQNKAAAGLLLTVTQVLVLGGVAAGLDLRPAGASPWFLGLILLLVALDAFVWGLFASAYCPNVLTAVFAGIGLWVGSWLVTITVAGFLGLHSNFIQENGLVKLLLACVALWWSRKRFGQDDSAQAVDKSLAGPAGVGAVLWLVLRQGRVELWTLAALALIAGPLLGLQPLLLWPILTLLIGLICGFAVFGHEQAHAQQHFLGALRLPPFKVWLVKAGWWLAIASFSFGLAFYLGNVFQVLSGVGHDRGLFYALENAYYLGPLSWWTWLTLWLIYGFAFGLYFSLLLRRTMLAVLVGTFACLSVLALWLPSLLLGGLPSWQLFMIPGLLTIGSALAMRPWLGGRLHTGRPMASMIGVLVVGLVFLAAALYYRAESIPAEGPPFDVAAYKAELDQAAQNPAGELLRQAAQDFKTHQEQVDAGLGRVPLKLIWDNKEPGLDQPIEWESKNYAYAMGQVLEKGWPKEAGQLPAWLDRMMAGGWADQIAKAARLASGLIEDPRQHQRWTWKVDHPIRLLEQAGQVVLVRAMQKMREGKSNEALNHLETALALGRQLRHEAPWDIAERGMRLEILSLHVLDRWAREQTLPRPWLVSVLDRLTQMAKDPPDGQRFRQAAYLQILNQRAQGSLGIISSKYRLDAQLIYWSMRMPWERERLDRWIDQAAAAPAEEWPSKFASDYETHGYFVAATGEQLSTRQYWRWSWLQQVRGQQLQLALLLYQLDHGQPAAKLEDLTPRYLPALPVNPYGDVPFDYRVSEGEDFEGRVPGVSQLTAGQGVVSATTAGWNNVTHYFLVPALGKK